jgi:glycosyltransferase involved in cell wall biosynthesis
MTQQRRIVFPLEGFNVGGGLRIVTYVANALTEAGHQVCLIVPDYASRPPFALNNSVQLCVIRTPGISFLKKLFYLAKLCLMSTRGADVAVATGYRTSYFVSFSKWLSFSRVKLVYLLQHYEPVSHPGGKTALSRRMFANLARLSYGLPLRKIAVSNWIKDQVGDDSIVVINNGIDLGVFHPVNDFRNAPERFTIGTVAGGATWKGYSVFLAAIEQLPAEEKARLRVLVASQYEFGLPAGISADIIKPRNENELVAFYHSCDAFICSSYIEGFGLTPLEAMACGVPVITTNCGGVSQYASPSNCILVPPGDSEAISNSVVRLRRDDALKATLRENGLETSRQFSVERMGQEYCRLLSDI